MSVTADVSHADRSALKLAAPKNICLIVVTLDVSHDERSALNDDANANIAIMSCTALTSHALTFAELRAVHPAKHPRREVVPARSGDPVVAEMFMLEQPWK